MNYVELTHRAHPLRRLWVGVVVDVQDPQRLGRVRVRVPGLLDGLDEYPWAHPLHPPGLGGDGQSGWFSVPELQSQVLVVFPYEDIYVPFYIGTPQFTSTHQTLFDTNYPERYGWTDGKGNHWYVDKATGEYRFVHQSGTQISVDSAGSVVVSAPGPVQVTVNGDVVVQAGGTVQVSGALIQLN